MRGPGGGDPGLTSGARLALLMLTAVVMVSAQGSTDEALIKFCAPVGGAPPPPCVVFRPVEAGEERLGPSVGWLADTDPVSTLYMPPGRVGTVLRVRVGGQSSPLYHLHSYVDDDGVTRLQLLEVGAADE